jgi:hypothetical protein
VITCPRCGAADLVDAEQGWMACPACGHRAASAYVRELDWLAYQQQVAEQRLTWLRQRVADSSPVVDVYGGGFAAATSRTGSASPARRTLTTQQALLTVGGMLLVAAAGFFLALNWRHFGVAAQAAFIVLLVAALAAASEYVRPRTAASASALAATSVGVAALALAGAPKLLLGPTWSDSISAATWFTVSGFLIAGVGYVAGTIRQEVGYRRAAYVVAAGALISHLADLEVRLSTASAAVVMLIEAAAIVVAAARLNRLPLALFAVPGGVFGLFVVADDYLDGGWGLTLAACAMAILATLAVADRRSGETLPAAIIAAALGLAASLAFGSAAASTALVLLLSPMLAATVRHALERSWEPACWAFLFTAAAGALVRQLSASEPSDREQLAFAIAITIGLFAAAVLNPLLRWAVIPATVTAWIAIAITIDLLDFHPSVEGIGVLAAAPPAAAALVWALTTGQWTPTLALWALPLGLLTLPTAVASAENSTVGAVRAVTALGIAAVLAWTGVRYQLLAPTVVAIGVAAVAAVGQSANFVGAVPRWVALTVAGAALLSAGMRIEVLANAARSARRRLLVMR